MGFEDFYFVLLVFGIFPKMFCLESALIEEKALVCDIGRFVLGCFFGLGFVLFAGLVNISI
jgi:hypothetical protein